MKIQYKRNTKIEREVKKKKEKLRDGNISGRRRRFHQSSTSCARPRPDIRRRPGENKYENETEWKYTIVFGLGTVVVVGPAGGRAAGDCARRRSIRMLYGKARARVANITFVIHPTTTPFSVCVFPSVLFIRHAPNIYRGPAKWLADDERRGRQRVGRIPFVEYIWKTAAAHRLSDVIHL